jgi:hypothetical protein
MSTVNTFECSVCGVDFGPDEGGICAKCGKLFCGDHLFEVKKDREKIFLCKADKGELRGKKARNNIILALRRYFPK